MAIKPFNSVAGFSVGEIPANIILANGEITTSNANLTGNLYVTNTANVGNLRTDHLLYANGQPWDLQEAAGSNTQIQYNIDSNFAASANFTYNDVTQLFSVLGNANISKTLFGNVANFTGTLTTDNLTANTNINFTGASNVTLGSVSNLHISGGSADQVLKTDGAGNLSWSSGSILSNGYSNVTVPTANGNVIINANAGVDQQWTFGTDGNLTGPSTGLANLGNLVIANYGNFSSNVITGNLISNALTSTRIPYVGASNNLTDTTNLTWDNPNQVLKIGAGGTEIGGDAGFGYIQTKTGNFSGNINSLNANLGNLATANFVNVSSNLNVTNTANVGNLRTDNLLYANGQPWDLQEAAGSNTQLQFNDGNNNFGASANLTFDFAANILKVDGNANVTGTTQTANAKLTTLGNTQVVYGNSSSFLVGSSNFVYNPITSELTVIGNIVANSFVGNISGNLSAPGANTEIIFNDNNIANAVGNFTYDKAFNSGGGLLDVGNTVGGQIITDNVYASYANIGNANVTGNITAGGNIVTTGSGGDITMSGGNISGANVSIANTFSGNLLTANFANIASNTITNNLTVNLALSGNTANFTGNVVTNNLTVNLELSGNTANFTGNIIASNIVGALANGTSNVKVYNNANVEITIGGSANVATIASTGLYVLGEINTTAGNMLSNGNITANGFLNSANARVTGEANIGSVLTSNITAPTGTITISAAGANNNIILSPTGVGNVDVGLHNIIQVGAPVNPNDAATKEYVDNISQGLFIHPSANVTTTSNLTATYLNGGTVLSVTTISGGNTITFSTNHGLSIDSDIEFTNSFNGIIAGEGYFVFSIPAPNQITIKDGYFGAQITTLTNATGLTQPALGEGGVGATLTNAGAQVALTIDSILMTVGKRILVQGQTNQTENGIYVVSVVGTGATNWVLTRASDGDSYAPKSETQLCAGSYFFITQGTIYAGTSFVLITPPGEIHFGTSNITFAQFSASGGYTAGSGIALNGTIISANVDLNTTDIVGGNIVVKTGANLTTPNIGDATFQSITWSGFGSGNGNVTANNLSIGNVANITLDLTVGGTIQSNGNISSNANVNSNNTHVTNFLEVGANVLANNVNANTLITVPTANVSNIVNAGNVAITLELSGNTANFSTNVITEALTVNLELSGNTANFTGNIGALNANLGNLATANYVNVSQQINGNVGNFSGNIFAPAIVQNASTYDTRIELSSAAGIIQANVGGNLTQFLPGGQIRLSDAGTIYANTFDSSQLVLQTDASLKQLRSGNVTLEVGTGGITTKTWTFAQDGTLYAPGNLNVNAIVSDNLAANLNVFVGDTRVSWGSVTTTSITGDQPIVSIPVAGITGIEYLVKGIDATGAKYSVATVQAVTDGTNVDYSTFGTINLGGMTGVFNVQIVAPGNIELQVTPSSANSTVWTTQVRLI